MHDYTKNKEISKLNSNENHIIKFQFLKGAK